MAHPSMSSATASDMLVKKECTWDKRILASWRLRALGTPDLGVPILTPASLVPRIIMSDCILLAI